MEFSPITVLALIELIEEAPPGLVGSESPEPLR